jgi:lipoyl(octanoyl) transferase
MPLPFFNTAPAPVQPEATALLDSLPAGNEFAPPPQGRVAAPARQAAGLEWRRSHEPVAYDHSLRVMEERVAAIVAGHGQELVWLLEHPPLVTAGTSAVDTELLEPTRFPVHRAGRGGKFTYHGPGQRIAYAVLDLERRRRDLRWYVHNLEEWAIRTLAAFGVQGERREGRIGIWVTMPGGRECKIGAIGVRVRRWVAYHGIALNVAPNLEHFSAIVPCGISEHGVTSLADLGIQATMADVDRALRCSFPGLLAP